MYVTSLIRTRWGVMVIFITVYIIQILKRYWLVSWLYIIRFSYKYNSKKKKSLSNCDCIYSLCKDSKI